MFGLYLKISYRSVEGNLCEVIKQLNQIIISPFDVDGSCAIFHTIQFFQISEGQFENIDHIYIIEKRMFHLSR